MYKCPVCDYENEKKSSVKAHLTASVEGDHHGMSGRNDHQMITETDSEPAREPDDEPNDQTGSDAELSSPAWPDGGDDGEAADERVCENCGNEELYAPDAVLRSRLGERMAPEHREMVRDSDAFCTDCGAVMDFD